MKTVKNDNTLTLYPEGRIDSSNAAEWEREVLAAIAAHPGTDLAIDAENLTYISSAGLRVLMKLKKQTKKSLPVWNVSPNVFEIFEITGFTNLLEVHKVLREISVDGCEVIGRGSFGIVYRIDPETIVKVYRDGVSLAQLQEENRYATAAFIHDIPTAIAYDTVKVGNCYGNVYELLDAVTVGRAVMAEPARAEELGKKMGRLFRQIHETRMEPGVLPRISDKFRARIDYLGRRHLSHEDAELMRQVVDAIPETMTLLHGDFHEGNVMVRDGELMLIDLDNVCVGNPLYDFMSSYSLRKVAVTSDPQMARASMNLEPELIPVMDSYERPEFLGTNDPATMDEYIKTMELFFPFRYLLLISVEQTNRRVTPEMVAGIKERYLPVLRKTAPEMIEAAGNLPWGRE